MDFQNGNMTGDGSIFTFLCDTGYDLEGVTSVTCDSVTGKYIGTFPACVGKKYVSYYYNLFVNLFLSNQIILIISLPVNIYEMCSFTGKCNVSILLRRNSERPELRIQNPHSDMLGNTGPMT